MLRVRPIMVGSVLMASLLVGAARPPGAAAADSTGADSRVPLTAYLDGRPIPLAEVSKYFCDDFSYPEIQCSSSRLVADARTTVVSLFTAVDYVTIFDTVSYGGAFMNVSQDYTALVLIGWSDRISSFKARNGATGRFYLDWFYGGSYWPFCCDQQTPSLGAYDNTFSSVRRT